jgi:hypothetical protein
MFGRSEYFFECKVCFGTDETHIVERRGKKEEGKCNMLGIFRWVVALYHP